MHILVVAVLFLGYIEGSGPPPLLSAYHFGTQKPCSRHRMQTSDLKLYRAHQMIDLFLSPLPITLLSVSPIVSSSNQVNKFVRFNIFASRMYYIYSSCRVPSTAYCVATWACWMHIKQIIEPHEFKMLMNTFKAMELPSL